MNPPGTPRRWLGRLLTDDVRDVIIGDLDEEFARHARDARTRSSATAWYWRQAIG